MSEHNSAPGENANCADYVTEKLNHVSQAGELPIVDRHDVRAQ